MKSDLQQLELTDEQLGGRPLVSDNASSSCPRTINPKVEGLPLGDKEAMLKRYLSLVKIVVGKMRDKLPSFADIEELESVGVIGLINAIDRFDPERGYTFETYATIRIRGAVLDELRNLDMVPRSVRMKQKKLKRTIDTLEQKLGRDPTENEVRNELGLDEKKYYKLKNQTAPLSMLFLDSSVNVDEDFSLHEAVADDAQSSFAEKLEEQELQELVAKKILDLPETQKKVLALYFFEELRLAEIGRIMGVSEARVSQIRSQALSHLRTFVSRMTY